MLANWSGAEFSRCYNVHAKDMQAKLITTLQPANGHKAHLGDRNPNFPDECHNPGLAL